MSTEIATKYKETDIGNIPEEWGFSNIEEFFDVKNGKTNSVDADENGIFPLFDRSTEIKRSNKYLFDSEAVIIPGEGADFIPRFYNGKFDLHQRAYAITPKNGKHSVNIRFLFYWILAYKNWLSRVAVGSTVKSLRLGMLTGFPLAILPKNEQDKIVDLLLSIDDKIELNRQINLNLEKLAQILFKELFVNKIEDGIPDGWSIGKFGQIAENFDSKRIPLSGREREKRHGQYPYYGATSIMDFVDDFIFDGTYVLLGEDGSVAKEDGKPFVQYVSGKFWANNHAHVLQGKNGFTTEYIKVFLDQVDILPFVTGAVQPKINQANMNSIPVVIPDKKTLNDFNRVIFDFFRVISINEKQIQTLKILKDSLLPKLMSGKIRVN